MIGSLGWQELLIILVILALIFGASRVTALGRSLGQGIREFREEVRRDDDEEEGEGEGEGEGESADAAAPAGATGSSKAAASTEAGKDKATSG